MVQNDEVRRRVADILAGALFGLVLSFVTNIWTEVYSKLVLDTLNTNQLWWTFAGSSLAVIVTGIILFRYIGFLERT